MTSDQITLKWTMTSEEITLKWTKKILQALVVDLKDQFLTNLEHHLRQNLQADLTLLRVTKNARMLLHNARLLTLIL